MGRRYRRWGMILLLVGLGCSSDGQLPGGSGMIEATEVVVSAEVSGQLNILRFDEGETVAAGDTLGMIDTVTTQLRVRQAEAACLTAEARVQAARIAIEQSESNLALAKKEFERVASLLKTGSANQQLYDQAETARTQALLSQRQAEAAYTASQAELGKARADLDLLHQQMSDCFPTAPQSGVVVTKFAEAGELIAPGRPLLKIAKLDTVWVKVYLPPEELTKIKLGGVAQVDPEDGRASPLTGRIAWISDVAEFTPKNVQTKQARADLVYAVKITIPNRNRALKVGMPVAVRIP